MSDNWETALATGVPAMLTAGVAFFGYLKTTSYRDKVASSRKAFDSVVASLASESEVTQLAGAILLRRFFDENSEVNPPVSLWEYLTGGRMPATPNPKRPNERTPYAPDAISVIAGILRSEHNSNFQKSLADGLAFAPNLRGADLQRTNLHYAYLGSKGRVLDLSGADFYRADLSGASLKKSKACGAFFYQARMVDAILSEADLTGASFFEADLLRANFDGATLTGATFIGTRNIPPGLAQHIKNSEWHGPPVFDRKKPTQGVAVQPTVYVSKPGSLDGRQENIVELVRNWLDSKGVATAALERKDYPPAGGLAELRRQMMGCSGAVVFGFTELQFTDGVWRKDSAEPRKFAGALPTPWVQIEAGMASMIGLPLMLISDAEVTNGVFDPELTDHKVFRLMTPPDKLSPEMEDWLLAVNERAARSKERP